MGLPSPQMANNGFAMLQHAISLLEEICGSLNAIERVTVDRGGRMVLHEGAMAFSYTVGPTGIANRTGFSGPNALEANPKRRGSSWFNASGPGGPNITLGLGQISPNINNGITLTPGMTWDGRIGDLVWTGSVAPVASAAGALLTGVEA